MHTLLIYHDYLVNQMVVVFSMVGSFLASWQIASFLIDFNF